MSSSDKRGGASLSAYRLHQALRDNSVDSYMLVENKVSDDPRVIQFLSSTDLFPSVRRRIRRVVINRDFGRYSKTRPPNLDLFSDDRSRYGDSVMAQLPPHDVLHLHWISSFVDIRQLVKNIKLSTPLVWTLHDMNPFTGGCHFTMSCVRYQQQCGDCPQLGSKHARDLSNAIYRRKAIAYRNSAFDRLHLVSPSQWLAAEVSKSPLLSRFKVSRIPYSINSEVFKPGDPRKLKEELQISEQCKVILFVAEMTWNARKGLDLLITALQRVRAPTEVVLLTVGAGDVPSDLAIRHVALGRVDSESAMVDAYNLADIFVAPSREDNLPNTVLEAMSCGTAVVAFRVGGLPDLVRNGETGFLAEPFDTASLAQAINQLLSSDELRRNLGGRGREIAVSEYNPTLQAKRYSDLYRDALGRPDDAGSPH